MADIKQELVKMLNKGLELEHAARIQYLAHAELIKGINSEKVIERIREIAGDEEKHEAIFRNLIGAYLGGEPSMGLAETHKAKEIKDILNVNLKAEKGATDFYKQIYQKVKESKKDLPYEYERLEHDVRHVIVDEEEHIVELSQLLGI